MNNPLEMLKMIKNPKEFVMNYMKQNNNPMFNNLMQMAEKNDTQGLENFARNLYKEQGRDFDKEFNDFKNMFNQQNHNS